MNNKKETIHDIAIKLRKKGYSFILIKQEEGSITYARTNSERLELIYQAETEKVYLEKMKEYKAQKYLNEIMINPKADEKANYMG